MSIDDEPAEFIPLVLETAHSRFPVIGENKDDVIGILLAKELLHYYAKPESFNLREMLRPGGVRAGVEAPQRAAARLPRQPQSHRDRRRRVRRRVGPRHDRGRARADRRRHRGRVRLRRERGQHHRRGERPLPRQGADRDRRLQRRTSAPTSPTTSSTPSAASCCRRSAACPSAARRRRSTASRFHVLRADSRRLYTLQVETRGAAARRRRRAAPQRDAQVADGARALRGFARAAALVALARGRGDGVRLRAVRPGRCCRSSRSRCCSRCGRRADARAPRRASASRSGSASSAPARRGSTSRSTRSAACRRCSPRIGTAGLLRLPRAVSRARRLARRALHGAADRGARARGRRARGRSPNGCAAACFTGFPLALARLRAGARRSSARGLRARSAACSLVTLAVAAARGAAGARDRRVRARGARARARRALRRRSSRSASAARAVGASNGRRRVGAPVAVSLVQGNVAQDLKFDPEFRDADLRALRRARARRAAAGWSCCRKARSRCSPTRCRTACCSSSLRDGARARRRRAASACSRSSRRCPASDEPRYLQQRRQRSAPREPQLYRKRHLVPFGETIPLEAGVRLVHPQRAGDPARRARRRATATQPPLDVAGQRVAVNICYEDAFGAEHPRRRPRRRRCSSTSPTTRGTGTRSPREQHNQIAAMRALETGRPMLRATNTGITSAIGHDGREIARLPWFTRGILEVEIAGRQGVTPYRALRRRAGRIVAGACVVWRHRARGDSRRSPVVTGVAAVSPHLSSRRPHFRVLRCARSRVCR